MFQLASSSSITNLDHIAQAAEHFKAIELSVDFAMDNVSDELLAGLIDLRDRLGLTYSVHAPFRDVNIASLNNAVYEAARIETLRAMEVAIVLGARLVNLHPGVHGYFPKTTYAEMKRREREVLRQLCDLGEEHNILVAFENLIETNVHFEDTWSLDGVIETVTLVDSPVLGFCLDTGHGFQAGLDIPAAVRRLAGVQASHGRSGSALIHVHAQDNHGGPIDEHLPIGDGLIPWPETVQALVETGYDGMIVFENFGLERQQTALNHWMTLQPER